MSIVIRFARIVLTATLNNRKPWLCEIALDAEIDTAKSFQVVATLEQSISEEAIRAKNPSKSEEIELVLKSFYRKLCLMRVHNLRATAKLPRNICYCRIKMNNVFIFIRSTFDYAKDRSRL